MSFKPIPNLNGTQADFTGGITAGAITGSTLTINTNTLFVDSSNEKVGMGTTSPTEKLHIESGNLLIKPNAVSASHSGLLLGINKYNSGKAGLYGATDGAASNTDGNLYISTRNVSSSNGSYIQLGQRSSTTTSDKGTIVLQAGKYNTNNQTGDILLKYGITDTVTLQGSSGNVGIGTTSPSSLLHLASIGPAVLTIEADTDNATETDNARIILKQDGALVVGRIGYENNTNALEFINEFADSLSLGTNGNKRFTITGSGNASFTGAVGINTSSPGQKLHVYQGTAKFESTNGSDNSLQIGRSDVANLWNFNHAGNDLRLYNAGGSGYDILLGVNSGGTSQSNKVGVNTANPSHQLHVDGTFKSTGASYFDSTVEVGSSSEGGFILTSPGGGRFLVTINNSGEIQSSSL